jgi:hypothetical protein
MKLRTLVVLLACAMAGPVAAQQSASQVTQAQVAEYKANAEKACKEGGRQAGDPEARVDAFCSCLMEVLDKSMTAAEWQQAYFLSTKKQVDEERKIVTPHMSKLEVCRVQP